MNKWLPYFSIMPFLIALCFGCANIKSLEFAGIDGVSIKPLSLINSEIGGEILLYNPNKKNIYVDKWEAAFYINNRLLTNLNSDSNFVISKLDTLRYPIAFKINNLALAGGAIDFLGTGNKQYRLTGNARAGTKALKITMPFDETGDLKF